MSDPIAEALANSAKYREQDRQEISLINLRINELENRKALLRDRIERSQEDSDVIAEALRAEETDGGSDG